MNDSNSLTMHLLKNNSVLSPPTSEILDQQLMCMNNLLAINSCQPSALNANHLSQFTKERFCEYQLAKLRFNQELLNSNPLYSMPYNYAPYTDVTKTNVNPRSFSRVDGNHYRYLQDEPKPQHSYIGLIAIAILSMPDQKMVLSDIYQHILDNYPYFRNRGPGWRNSIRHNLSLNDCFIKAGRSANGKGHYWAIHPANLEDFKKGDFRRRKAQRKVRKHMGLAVPEDDEDEDDTPISSPAPVLPKTHCSPEQKPALMTPNPFVQAMTNPLFSATNPYLSQQAFSLFNSLRFAFPSAQPMLSPPTNFNETLYKQLINLNIKQDLQHNACRPANRKEFSIESLLSSVERSHDSDFDSESDSGRKSTKLSTDEECVEAVPLRETLQPPPPQCTPPESNDQCRSMQPVNLKMN